MDKFVATWRGRVFAKQKLDPSKVAGLGILLGDKKPGAFKLEVDWIKASKSMPNCSARQVLSPIASKLFSIKLADVNVNSGSFLRL